MSHKRSREDDKRLKKLYEETKNSYIAGAYYNEHKDRYIRYTSNNEWTKTENRKYTRRKLNNSPFLLQRNQYKKVQDYKWEIT